MIVGFISEVFFYFFLFLSLCYAILSICMNLRKKRPRPIWKEKNFLIIGGSEGIGLEMAKKMIKEKASSVVLVSRSEKKLQLAVDELNKLKNDSQVVFYVSMDVTKKETITRMTKIIFDEKKIDIDQVFFVQGKSAPVRYFFELKEDNFEELARINYLGTVNVLKQILPRLYKTATESNPKHVLFTASALACCTCMGWTSYAPSKYAIKGFAETLENEFLGFPIHFYLAYPRDTKTPGFEEESKGKPLDCIEVTKDKIFSAEESASQILGEMKKGHFYLNTDFGVNCLITQTRGFGPLYRNPYWEILRIILFGPVVLMINKLAWNKTAWKYVDYRRKEFSRILEEKKEVIVDVEKDEEPTKEKTTEIIQDNEKEELEELSNLNE